MQPTNCSCQGFLTCTTKDLHVDQNGKDYLKATLETLSQLHGTGLHFKKSLGGNKGVLERFPKIEEQIQIKVISIFDNDINQGDINIQYQY